MIQPILVTCYISSVVSYLFVLNHKVIVDLFKGSNYGPGFDSNLLHEDEK